MHRSQAAYSEEKQQIEGDACTQLDIHWVWSCDLADSVYWWPSG
jgi:hypothetical protein